MRTKSDQDEYSVEPQTIIPIDGQYDDVEYMLVKCSTMQHECDYHDAVNRIEIRLKTLRHAISVSRMVVEHTYLMLAYLKKLTTHCAFGGTALEENIEQFLRRLKNEV